MSFPCINATHFQMVGGTDLQPQDYMQWRHVATNTLLSNTYTYTPVGSNPSANLADLQVQWTNSSPITQVVYGMITRGASKVITQARGVAGVQTSWGQTQGASPADPTVFSLLGLFGNGGDSGTVGSNALFMITESRMAEHTYPVGPAILLPATQTVKLRIRLAWNAIAWESTGVDGGNTNETEASLVTGDTRLDLFSIPSL